MKRLIKKADTDYSTFLTLLLNDNVYSQEEISQVINDNQDCVFNGSAYRVFLFYKEEVKNAKEKAMKDLNGEESFPDIFELLWATLDYLITPNGQYQSFSKSESGVQNAENHLRDGQDYSFVIKYDVNNALDVEKLFEKYKDELNEEAKEAFNYFKGQEEILAKFESDEYYYVRGFSDMSELRYL